MVQPRRLSTLLWVFAWIVTSHIANAQTLCAGGTNAFGVDLADGADGTPGSIYTWSIQGTGFAGTTTNPTKNTLRVNWGNTPAGTYTIVVQETDINGCLGAPQQYTVTLNPLPQSPVLKAQTPICIGQTATFELQGISGDVVQYQLNGATGTTTLNSSGMAQVSVPNATSNAILKLVSVSRNTCSLALSEEKTIAVQPYTQGSISSSKPAIIRGEKVTLTASGGDTYQWSNGATSPSIEVSPTTTTTYSVSIQKNGSCPSVYSLQVQVAAWNLILNGDYHACLGSFSRTISPTTPLPAESTYQWSNGATTPSITVNTTGTYTLTVTAGGVQQSASVSITQSQISIVPTETQSCLETVLAKAEGNYPPLEYALDQAVNFQSSNQFINQKEGTHTLYVRDAKGCITSGQVEVKTLFVPNFFSPNGDGQNDTWQVGGLENCNAKISILDRYGRLLKVISPTETWDGTYQNKPLPTDDYWYLIQTPNDQHVIKGNFTLKRK